MYQACSGALCGQESQSKWGLEIVGESCVTRGAWGSQTMLSLVGHGKDAAFYSKSSGEVLKGFKPHEQMCVLWLGMIQNRPL